MDFWDSYNKPKAQKKTKPATKQVTKTVNTKQNNPQTANISINISLPQLSILKKLNNTTKLLIKKANGLFSFLRTLITRKVLNISLIAVIVFSLSMIAVQLISSNKSQEVAAVDGASAQSKPDFKLVYPAGSKKDTSYDANKKVASFNDQIGDTQVTISQQSLPVNFRYDPNGEVEKLAKQINANTKLGAEGVSAFMGQSIKGPQTVVFSKNGLLIFIKSEKMVDTKNWNDYVSSLN